MTNPLYIIEQDFGHLGHEISGCPEATREMIVDQVRVQEHRGLTRIIELSPDGTWKDITRDIAADVYRQLYEERERPSWEMLGWLQNHGAAPDNLQAAE